jgi:phosphoribosylformimino-5-aminoimidazole carboxamide ribotide isomerase
VIAAPALDLREGKTVQLVGGRLEHERVSLPDPLAVARRWWRHGFRTLHVVDLDRALGTGENTRLVGEVLSAWPAEAQVGGGLRDDEAVEAQLGAGAARVVVGTRAVDDPAWLAALAGAHPGRVMVAADVREGRVLRRGWTETAAESLPGLLARLAELPLAGVLCTDVGREGRMEGIDVSAASRTVAASAHPVWISGGIRSMDDLRAIEETGARGAVLGMALYTGVLDPDEVAETYGGVDPSGSPR